MEEVRRRLVVLERKHDDEVARLTRLEVQLQNLAEDVSNIVAEVGRVPTAAHRGSRKSLGDRMHEMEKTNWLTEEVTNELRRSRTSHQEVWASWTGRAIAAGAIISAVGVVLRLAGVGG